MNYHAYHSVDVVNGPGTRCTLFVSGCEHRCKGCYNVKTWPLSSGIYYTQAMEETIISDLKDTRIPRQGLSLSGGDPLHPANLAVLSVLVKRVKRECSGKDIWCWTGYEYAELSNEQRNFLNWVDVLIDGRFEEKKKEACLLWRGSSNQKVYHLAHSEQQLSLVPEE